VVRPKAKRVCVKRAVSDFGLSLSRGCRLVGLNRSTFSYKPKPDNSEVLRTRMKELAEKHIRYGSPRLHVLLKGEGLVVNHKRTERIYYEEGLSIRRKKRKKRIPAVRVVLEQSTVSNQVWSMDFVSDSLFNCRRFRILTVVDNFSKESPLLLTDSSISGERVTRALDELPVLPKVIRVDNGPEFTSKAMLEWAHRRGIKLDFIRPGKPTDNAFIESFNGKFRDECLNQRWFTSLNDAKEEIESWRKEYNEVRPHSSLGYLPPAKFAKRERLRLTA